MFKDSILDEHQFALLYGDMDCQRWESSQLYPTERLLVRALRRKLASGSSILDFGCSSGRLLAELVGSFRCSGFEINEHASQIAASKGIEIIPNWAELIRRKQEFDALLLVDVFEHLENPLETLQALAELLKENGLLIVVTGNADCWAAGADLANFWYFRTIQHVGMLTRKHALYIAGQCSLALSEWQSCRHYDLTLQEAAKQYSRHLLFSHAKSHPESPSVEVAKRLPFIRNFRNWKIPPPFTASKDHIMAIFKRVSVEPVSSEQRKIMQ